MSQGFVGPFGAMGLPGQLSMPAEELYRRLGRHLQTQTSAPPAGGAMTAEQMRWVGQASALIEAFSDLGLKMEMQNAINGLNSPHRQMSYQKLLQIMHTALGRVELLCAPSVQGSFLPAGSPHDAFEAVARIFRAATKDILIIDPYMDATVLSDFCTTAPEHVVLRLLTDEGAVRPDLAPAGQRWKTQRATRPVEIRVAPARTLHDRAFIVDGAQAWTVTQSLKDLAARAHGEIVRADDIAQLKIAAYEDIWLKARPIV